MQINNYFMAPLVRSHPLGFRGYNIIKAERIICILFLFVYLL